MSPRAPHPIRRLIAAPLVAAAHLAALPVRAAAHVAVLPIRAAARTRPPAVADPAALHPGSVPPTGDRLLLLFDGACGICLHTRDLFGVLDQRRGRLAFDVIDRHETGLLAAMDPAARYASWHVVHPDGRVEDGGAGLTTVVGALPGGRWPARLMRRFPGVVDHSYAWFARNRSWISQGSGLIHHPQRVAD